MRLLPAVHDVHELRRGIRGHRVGVLAELDDLERVVVATVEASHESRLSVDHADPVEISVVCDGMRVPEAADFVKQVAGAEIEYLHAVVGLRSREQPMPLEVHGEVVRVRADRNAGHRDCLN